MCMRSLASLNMFHPHSSPPSHQFLPPHPPPSSCSSHQVLLAVADLQAGLNHGAVTPVTVGHHFFLAALAHGAAAGGHVAFHPPQLISSGCGGEKRGEWEGEEEGEGDGGPCMGLLQGDTSPSTLPS